jgi:hypothetical protein
MSASSLSLLAGDARFKSRAQHTEGGPLAAETHSARLGSVDPEVMKAAPLPAGVPLPLVSIIVCPESRIVTKNEAAREPAPSG